MFNRLLRHYEKDLYESLIMIHATSKLDNGTRTFYKTLQSVMDKTFKKK